MNKLLMMVMMAAKNIIKGKAYFDGVGDYLTLASNAGFGFGTGDFTVEVSAIPTSFGTVQDFIDGRTNGQVAEPWLISITNTGLARSYDGTLRTGGQLTANVLNKVKWCRASNVNSVYVNDVLGHTWTELKDYGSARPLSIGRLKDAESEVFAGFMTGIRITKGRARNGESTPDVYTIDGADVTLCMNFAEPIGSTTFIDDTGKTVTTYGNTVIVE